VLLGWPRNRDYYTVHCLLCCTFHMSDARGDEFVSIEMVQKQALPHPVSVRKAWLHCIGLALFGGCAGAGIACMFKQDPVLASLLSWVLALFVVSLYVYNIWLCLRHRTSMLSTEV
jgi:hypothetical protein